jgi:hypothetical protein
VILSGGSRRHDFAALTHDMAVMTNHGIRAS